MKANDNVLIIDDDLLTSELVKEILSSNGYNCEICNHVGSLQKYLNSSKFNIFLVDLMLDGLTGIDLVRDIRGRFAEAIIFVITGLGSSEHLQGAIAAGADHFYNKPVNTSLLLKRLASISQKIQHPPELSATGELFKIAFSKAVNPVFIIDSIGDLFYANSRFIKHTGIDGSRITRYNLQSLRLRNAFELGKLVEACDSTQLETKILETRFSVENGSEAWFNVIINPIRLTEEDQNLLFLFQLYDITRKKQMDNFILNNEEKFRSFIGLSNDGMALINEKGQVIEWNGSLSNITGISMEKVYGELIWDILSWAKVRKNGVLISPVLIKKFIKKSLREGLEEEESRQDDCQISHADGSIVHLQYSLFTIRVDKGYRLGMVIRDNTETVNDRRYIAEQNEKLGLAYEKMEKLARIDPLTQIANRRDVEIRINYELTRFERHKQPFSLAIADIDSFKIFNDTYGHDMGDFVLKEIAELIGNTIRAQDILGRWGGEEFILVFPETNLAGGRVISEKVRQNIANHKFRFKNELLNVTITIGITEFREGEDLDGTFKRADNALYKGKKSGKNCVIVSR
jgi:diguanylate cyclase (GGDEF)-like protein/PAS domain S-box-containing protein